jgi:hypothetical protein
MPTLFDIFKKLGDTDKNNKIVYDYNNIDIKKNDIVFDKKTNNLKIPVTFPVNVPNVTYPNSLNSYTARNIYISALLHSNIENLTETYRTPKNVNVDSVMGELIIEHEQITGTGTLYTCFLFKFVDNNVESNDVDKLLNMYKNNQPSITFNLNKTIPTQDYCIIYKPKNSITTMVFTTPIYLNQNSYEIFINKKNKILVNIFGYNDNYIVLPKANISQRGEEEIYIDCTPTGESAETIATYNVPIQSEYTRDWGKLDFMKMTIQLLMVFILLLTTYFGVPIMYKRVVVDNISRLDIDTKISFLKKGFDKTDDAGYTPADKHIRNITVDWALFLFSSLIIGFSFLFSISSKNYNYLQYTVYLFIFGILSIAIIAFNKSSGYFKEDYIIKDLFDIEKYYQQDVNSIEWKYISNLLRDIGSFLGEALIGTEKKNLKNWAMVGGFLTFTYIFLIIFRWGIRTINHSTFLFLCWFLPIFIIIPSSLITVLNLYKLETNPIHKS